MTMTAFPGLFGSMQALEGGDLDQIDPFWTMPDDMGRTMLELVATSANDGVWGWDVPTGRSYYSSRWWELLGESDNPGEAHLDSFIARLHPDDRDRVEDAMNRFIRGTDLDYRMEFRLRHAAGGWRWILSRGSAIRGADGQAIRIAGTHTDITERAGLADRLEGLVSKRTQELVAARDRAEVSAAATSRFLSATSHDIRQPLQAMALLLGSLRSENLSPSGQRTLDGVHRSLISSMALLDDLLEYSRLDAGALRPVIGMVNMRDLFAAVEDNFTMEARERSIRLAFHARDLVGRSDAQLLARIVRNLVSNALKFTSRGSVVVAARGRGDKIRVEVWDTGVGIAPEMQRQIFWEFVQGKKPTETPANAGKGLGLGLAIVERLSQLLGHRIGMRSVPGKGSVFWVELDRQPAAIMPAHGDRPHGYGVLPGLPENTKIALLENDPEIGQAFLNLLRSWNYRVVWARSVESLLSQIATEKPDLLIADWHLDTLSDGFSAFDRLEERFGTRIPGVVLTGDNDFEAIARVNRAGRKLLHKPILPEILNAALLAELGERP